MSRARTMLRWILCAVVGAWTGAPQESASRPGSAASPADPEVTRIRALIERGEGEVRAAQNETAWAQLREAWRAAKELPRAEQRADVDHLRYRIGVQAYLAGDLRLARLAAEMNVHFRERTLGRDHPDLQRACLALGNVELAAERLDEARALYESVVRILAATALADNQDLLTARQNLAIVLAEQGDLRGALELQQRVYAERVRTLADDHADLQGIRLNLANTLRNLGDLRGALALHERVVAVWSKTLVANHPSLQRARSGLAITKVHLGDLPGARTLQEAVLASYTAVLPEGHGDLQRARLNLALTLGGLGDHRGAQALQEQVLRGCEGLPASHPLLLGARSNLAKTRWALGDREGARDLQREVLAVLGSELLGEPPRLQYARATLAAMECELGLRDPAALARARALQEKALAELSRVYSGDHPDLFLLRTELARTVHVMGDLGGTLALQERILEDLSVFPDEHPAVQRARRGVLLTRLQLGHDEQARTQIRVLSRGYRRALATPALGPAELGARVESDADDLLSDPLSAVFGCVTTQPMPELASEVLLLSEALRGAEIHGLRFARRVRASGKLAEARGLEAALGEASTAVTERARRPATQPGEHAEALADVVRRRNQIQRQLVALAATVQGFDLSDLGARDLAAALPDASAAVAIVRFTHTWFDPLNVVGGGYWQPKLAALVLHRDGNVDAIGLPFVENVEALVARARQAFQLASSGPRDGERDLVAALRALRRVVLDPILERLPGVTRLFLSVDESLGLLPMDALPLDDGLPLGTKVQIRVLPTLLQLLDAPDPRDMGPATLVTVGGLDYDALCDAGEPREAPVGVSSVAARGGGGLDYPPLPRTLTEVLEIQRLFRGQFPEGRVGSITGTGGDKSTLAAKAKAARFLHLATHGSFAPEEIRCLRDTRTRDNGRFSVQEARQATGLSPMVLAGLALSGANRPADALGRQPGIVTAEELMALDLSQCELVVLSACDTTLGVRRAGLAYASLRTALLAAGARAVVTSLWRVPDAKTGELMAAFYRRLWLDTMDPHRALWQAKMEIRGLPGSHLRDWAGWMLTGR